MTLSPPPTVAGFLAPVTFATDVDLHAQKGSTAGDRQGRAAYFFDHTYLSTDAPGFYVQGLRLEDGARVLNLCEWDIGVWNVWNISVTERGTIWTQEPESNSVGNKVYVQYGSHTGETWECVRQGFRSSRATTTRRSGPRLPTRGTRFA